VRKQPPGGITLVQVRGKLIHMSTFNKTGLIIGISGTAIIILGLLLMRQYDFGIYILYAGLIVVGVVWVWSIWDVIIADDLRFYQKMFWLIITISVPVMGGFLFYILHQKRNRIVT
jgi:hypothetical protein